MVVGEMEGEMKRFFKRLWNPEGGQEMSEYALLLLLICLSLVTAASALGTAINKSYTNAPTNLSAPAAPFHSYPSSSDTGSTFSGNSASDRNRDSSGQDAGAEHGRGNGRH